MTTWQTVFQINPRDGDPPRVNDISVTDDDVWTVSSDGYVRRSRADGTTEAQRLGGFEPFHLRCIEFTPDGSMGWIGVLKSGPTDTRFPRLLTTTDGSTWRAVADLPDDPVDGICGLRMAGDDTIFATGTYEESTTPGLWRLRLGGKNQRWQALDVHGERVRKEKASGAEAQLQITQLIDMHFWNRKDGIVVGGGRNADGHYRPLILRTDDGGDRWLTTPLPELKNTIETDGVQGRYAWKVFFVDDALGFVSVASYAGGFDSRGFVLKTTNGGDSWTPLSMSRRVVESTNLHGVGFADEQHGWTCGHDAPLVETIDGGRSWRRAKGEIRDINRMCVVNGTLYGAGNGLYRQL